ncbi:hypothetical protein [Actinotalea solisilvae]|uniref:hypothetical protein n=1 Tax=Actinotalea solisilvae TaxID=2072922 RepID=UPI0018F21E64|nr:hypothetical protein [Actinotalea solisilvae]
MNRSATRRRAAAAITLAALTSGGLLAGPAAASTPGTATLTVRIFEDRYPDGTFDDTSLDGWGETDRLRATGYVYLQDSAGAWYATGPEDSGEYVFDGIALGEAKVHVGDPNVSESVAFFVSDDDGATLMPHAEVGFTGGTFLFPGSDERIPWSGPTALGGLGTVTVDGAQSEALLGMTAVGASVQVLSATDGTPVADQATVTFLANGERIASTLVADGVTSYPGTRRLVPVSLGIEVTPVRGLAVAEVTARSSISGQPLAVSYENGAYLADATGLATYFDRAEFSVRLIDAATGAEQCKKGGWAAHTQPAFRNQGQCVSFFATARGGRG